VDKRELEERTKAFALRVVRFVSGLPKSKVTDVLGYQLPCPEPSVLGPCTCRPWSFGPVLRPYRTKCPRTKGPGQVPEDQGPVEGLKAGTSIGANYREANRAESHNDSVHKIGIVEKEASETQYWMELFGDSEERRWLLQESAELLAIFTASGRTAKARRARGR